MIVPKTFLVATLVLSIGSAPTAYSERDAGLKDTEMKVTAFTGMNYPLFAQSTHAQGVVVVKLTLDARGSVTNVDALSGSEQLTPPTVQNAKLWKFEPNSASSAILVYNFRIVGLCPKGQALSQFTLLPPNFASVTGCERTVEPDTN